MDTVVIGLLVLLGVIVLTKGKPLWSKLKTLLEQLKPLWPFIKETPLFDLLVGFVGILLAIVVVIVIIEEVLGIILVSDYTVVLFFIVGGNIGGIVIIFIKWILGPPYTKY